MNRLKPGAFIVLLVGLLALPMVAAAQPDRAGRATISLDFQWIRQGQVGIVRVSGSEMAEVRAVFQERLHHFYADGTQFIGLIAANMDREIGTYTMQVWINYADGTAERLDQPVEVNYGDFGRSEVTVSGSLLSLLEDEVEQVELAKFDNLLPRFTPEQYWADRGFITPVDAEIIGWFGAYRLYNGTYWRQHTGTDLKIPTGSPVIACASGRVILSEAMPIRGEYVLIDHGWGIYSGYAHMSQRLVVPGQWVRQGDTLGLSGNTGRSSGAHLHWEVAVAGAWIDPEAFLELGVGAPEK